MAHHLLIVNTHAGGGQARQRILTLMTELLLPGASFECVYTEAPGHAAQIAAERAHQADVLVAVGGDGTVGEVAGGLLESGAPAGFALLPIGTGNDAGRAVGIADWDMAVAALRGGAERSVDVLEVTCQHRGAELRRVALVGVGIGFPANLLDWTTERAKKLLGRWSYAYATVACVLRWRSPALEVTADGERLDGRYALVAACNAERTAGGTVVMAPGARVDDGLMDLVLVPDMPRSRLLALMRLVPDGRYTALPEVTGRQVRELRLGGEPARLNIDGDPVGATPATITVRPGMLRVRVPPA